MLSKFPAYIYFMLPKITEGEFLLTFVYFYLRYIEYRYKGRIHEINRTSTFCTIRFLDASDVTHQDI